MIKRTLARKLQKVSVATARLDGPLKWFGGKGAFNGKLAKWIISPMPPHLHYVEPYFGGGAVLLAKDPKGISEVVNDIHGELTNFWRVLQDERQFAKFLRIVSAVPFAEPLYDAASNGTASDPIQSALRFFIRCRQSRAGQFKDFATMSRTRTRRGMNEQASAWLSAVEGLSAVHARLKRVVILNRDAFEVIRQQDGTQTCFYLDPPYVHETREAIKVYEYEMTRDDHKELLRVLRDNKGTFLLSGYPNKLYDSMAKQFGWVRHEFQILNNASGRKRKELETECIWTNAKET